MCSSDLVTKTVSISAPSTLSLSAVTSNVSCFQGSDGTINLTVTGGTSPYNYSWSNSTSTEDQTNLTAGNYSVTVTDAGSCTATYSATISQPTIISLTFTKVDATCGNSDGSIDVTVTGGTAPYTYLWSNGATSQDLTAIPAATYTLTVTDAKGCVKSLIVPVGSTGGTVSDISGPVVVCDYVPPEIGRAHV